MLLYLIAGRVALHGEGDLLVRGASGTGRAMWPSPTIIGLPFVSLGTSASGLFVSAGAAWQGYGGCGRRQRTRLQYSQSLPRARARARCGTVFGGRPIGRDIRARRLPPMIAITPLEIAPLVPSGLHAVHASAPLA